MKNKTTPLFALTILAYVLVSALRSEWDVCSLEQVASRPRATYSAQPLPKGPPPLVVSARAAQRDDESLNAPSGRMAVWRRRAAAYERLAKEHLQRHKRTVHSIRTSPPVPYRRTVQDNSSDDGDAALRFTV